MAETCIWCGHEPMDNATHETVYACGTVQHPRSDVWSQSAGCEEIMQSRGRIKRAVEVLDGGDRIMMVLDDDDEDVSFVVPATDVDRAVWILEGEEDDDSNSSKSSNSSPITTDDLAASDYFEAVRQRVPWMTAVEHIEGLVEGYRRCGVMVWQTAEEIRKVHGGEHGKAY